MYHGYGYIPKPNPSTPPAPSSQSLVPVDVSVLTLAGMVGSGSVQELTGSLMSLLHDSPAVLFLACSELHSSTMIRYDA